MRRIPMTAAMTMLLGFLAMPGVASALTFTLGDVFVSVGSGQVKEFTPTGTLVQTLNTTTGSSEVTGSAFDAFGNLYVTGFQTSTLSKFNNDGTLASANFIAGNNPSNNESIVFDQAGNFYVGGAGGNQIRKFDSSGALLNSFTVAVGPRGTDWIDLAADQRTLFYTSEGGIVRRFDTVTNTQLTDFASFGGTSYALRLLSDGGALVAHTGNVVRLNSSGGVVQTCTVPGGTALFALNLDPDGTSFWTANINSTGTVFHVRISDCAVLNQFDPSPLVDTAGLSVFGEITQGGPGPLNPVPEPTTMLLLGSTLTGLGIARWRHRKLGK